MRQLNRVERAARRYQRRTGVSAAQWAANLNVSRQWLARILAGASLPSLPLAIRLRDDLGIPIEWLAGVDDGRVVR